MLLHARNIWDIKIQSVCGILSASDGDQTELFFSANFGQVTLDPPRVIINPNRLYPIEGVIRRERRFAINVLSSTQRDLALRAMNLRRRALDKPRLLGIRMLDDARHGIPYVETSLATLFCETEQILDTGDHTLMIARVLEARTHPGQPGRLPLLYPAVAGTPSKYPRLSAAARRLMNLTGTKDIAIAALRKRRPSGRSDLAANTYQEGGQTEDEIGEILRHGAQDRGRRLRLPGQAPAFLRRRIGVCVVGVGAWGSFHCQLFRQASANVDLYVCGRDAERVARVAHGVGARGYFVGMERAVEDARVQALSLVLPHDVHRRSVELAAAYGKHALVEKPIATTLEDADAMIEAARRADIILMVAEDMHFRPSVREAVRAIDRGDIGEPLYLDVRAGGLMRPQGWKADMARLGGGVLMDLGVHYVRAMRLLMGEPDRVFGTRAMQVNTKMSGEDSVQLIFASQYGWRAHMLLSWSSPRGHAPDMVVAGDKGVLCLWPGARYLDLYPAQALTLTRLLSLVRPASLAEKLMSPRLQRVRWRIPDVDSTGYVTEVRHFLSAIAEASKPSSRPEDARRDLEIVLRSYEALRQENWEAIRL